MDVKWVVWSVTRSELWEHSTFTQGNMDQERLKKQQELAAAALYQQLQHQQFLQLVNRYRGLEGPTNRDGHWLCGQTPSCLSPYPQPPPPAVWAPGKGSSGGPDTTAAAAAYRLPAAAPSSQTSQVCALLCLWHHMYEPSEYVKWGDGAAWRWV